MGTGVGEAMLIGAAVGATAGGAGAAIQGGDPMRGALTGGAMGAVGGGLGAAAGAGGGAAAGAGSGSTAGAAGGAGAGTGATTGSVFGGASGTAGGATSLGTSIGGVSGGSGTLGSAGFGATSGGAAGGAGGGAAGGSAAGGGAGGFGIGQGANYANFVNTAGSSAYGGMGGAGAGTTTAGGFGIAAPTTSASLGGAGAGTTAGTTGGTTGGAGTTGAEKNIFGYKPTDAGYLSNTQLGMTAGTAALSGAMQAERSQYGGQPNEDYDGPLNKLKYDPDKFKASNPTYAPSSVYRPTYAAEGGIMQVYQSGGPVERMTQMNTAMNPQGGLYPQGMIDKTQYATPTQRPTSLEVVESEPSYDARTNPMTGTLMARGGIARYDMGGIAGVPTGLPSGGAGAGVESGTPQGLEALMGGRKKRLSKEELESSQMQGLTPAAYNSIYGEGVKAEQSMAGAGLARGGISSLGGYSDGGRMLKGPGDGMSDNIPATIAGKQPARLADGEFVIPADVVSHLGNGSTDAGAKQLYAMMNRVRKARTGNSKQGKQIKPAKYLAA